MALDRLTHPGKALAGPHRQGLRTPQHGMEAMPGQTGQEAQGHRQQQAAPDGCGEPPLPPAQGKGG